MTHLIRTKNVLATGLVALTILGSTASASAKSPAAPGTKHMAVIVADLSVGALSLMAGGSVFAASDVGGIDMTVLGPKQTDTAKEVQMFEGAVSQSRDGVVLENLAPPAFTQPMAQAVAKGVPVVALDTEPSPGSNVTLYVGNDNYVLGVSLAQEAMKYLPRQASGTIVVNDATRGVPVFEMRAKGIMDTLSKALPRVKVIEVYSQCMDAGTCSASLLPVMRANPHALAFLGTADADSYTLAQLKKQLGGKYLTAAFDLDPRTLQAVKDGTNFCTVSPEHFLKGYIATRLLAEAVKTGRPLLKGWFDEPGLVVDQNLVDIITTRQSSDANMRTWFRPEIARIFANINSYMKPMSAAR